MNIGSLFSPPKQPYPVLKTVVVNLKSGTVFRGVVRECAGDFVILRNSEMLHDRGQVAKHVIDGEVIVRLAEIDFMQAVA
jgi:small nuclear ribonucleoprotein (snRNP)-like protein